MRSSTQSVNKWKVLSKRHTRARSGESDGIIRATAAAISLNNNSTNWFKNKKQIRVVGELQTGGRGRQGDSRLLC